MDKQEKADKMTYQSETEKKKNMVLLALFDYRYPQRMQSFFKTMAKNIHRKIILLMTDFFPATLNRKLRCFSSGVKQDGLVA